MKFPRRHGLVWSDSECTQLLWERGRYTIEEIAKRHDRTPRAIELQFDRLKALKNKPSPKIKSYPGDIIINSKNYSHLLRLAGFIVNMKIDLMCELR